MQNLLITLLLTFSFVLLLRTGDAKAQQFNYWFSEGVALFEMGDAEESVESFRRAIEEDPNHAEAYVYLLSALMASGDFNKAVDYAEKAAKRFPRHARLLALKGEVLYRIDPEEAVPVYRELRRLVRSSPERQVDGISLKMAERSLGLLHEQVGALRYDRGNSSGAVESLRSARRLIPDSLSVHNNLAFILIEMQDFEQATQVLDEALEYFPDENNLLLMKASIASESGSGEEAVEILRRLHEQNPADVNRAIAYGQALLNANQAVKANEFFSSKIERYPDERRYYRVLIELNSQRMNLSGMHHVLEMKRAQFPDDLFLAEEFAASLVMQRKHHEAHQLYDSLSVAQSSHRLARRAAHALVFGEDYDAASTYYKQLNEKWPQQFVFVRERGLILEHLGEKDAAANLYERYVRERPSGRFMVKLADITTDNQLKREMLELASETRYKPFVQRRNLGGQLREASDYKTAETVIDELMRMYVNRQEVLSSTFERELEDASLRIPGLFHERNEIQELSYDLNQMFDLLIKSGDFSESAGVFERLAERWPDSSMLYYQRGRLHAENRLYEEAVSDIRNSMQLGAAGKEVHMTLGDIWHKKGNYDQAALAYERALSENNQYAGAYRSLIRLSEEHNRLDELTDRWMSRYRNNRQNTVLREFLIEALHKADRIDEARSLN